MGTSASIVTYATRPVDKPDWQVRCELVEEMTMYWMVQKIESLRGKAYFVFLNETDIGVEEDGIMALREYLPMAQPPEEVLAGSR
jgi:hypothetical protein